MKLAHSLNRTVLVSIPAFFGDDETRACTLLDVDAAGLWLALDELRDRLGPVDVAPGWTSPVAGFFPFAQILYVIDPNQFARRRHRPTPPSSAPPSPPKNVTQQDSRGEGRRKQKDSKSRR